MRNLYTYARNQFQHWRIICDEQNTPCVSIVEYLRIYSSSQPFEDEKFYVDISSLSGMRKNNNPALAFQFEQMLEQIPECICFVCDSKLADDLIYDFRYSFDALQPLTIDIPSDEKADNMEIGNDNIKKTRIIDLAENELTDFFQHFSERLYGHDKFKDELPAVINSFRIFNKIGEHKILSFFLMGDSGVGKTEVARCIHKCLGSKRKIAKVNFGNYSSHDSLNSLIGSPRGYIGSDSGELFQKVQDSDIGLILIDEFEKAASPVYNYFLDVLENGKMTNSLGDEIDIEGYIIIFTSNVDKEGFPSVFSPELRSRFDYVGAFDLLTDADKQKYVQFRISSIIKKYETSLECTLSSTVYSKIAKQIDVRKYNNMRDLNKKIKDVFVEQVMSYFKNDLQQQGS